MLGYYVLNIDFRGNGRHEIARAGYEVPPGIGINPRILPERVKEWNKGSLEKKDN